MGAADVVPGVSGGTMAFILGIYEELLESIKSFNFKFLRKLGALKVREAFATVSWRFLIALGIGIGMAIISLARLLAWLLQNQPVMIWSFFFGLILASVFVILGKLKKWSWPAVIAFILGAILTYHLVGMVPLETPQAPWFLILCGALAICAMILPGISGSLILVLMGKYEFVLHALNSRDILPLLLVILGAIAGLLSFVRLLSWFLRKYRDLTIAFLSGLMVGSLRKVWPWKITLHEVIDSQGHNVPSAQSNTLPPSWNSELAASLLLMAIGFILIILLNLLASKREKAEETSPRIS
jgi:putative membrane protein